MEASVKRRSFSRLFRMKILWAAAAVVLVLLMTLLAFGLAGRKNAAPGEESAAPAVSGTNHSFSELYPLWESNRVRSWEGTLKHKHTEPVSVAPKSKYGNGGIGRESWYVTSDEYNDRAGNLRTIYNFCAFNWAGARQWLVENDNPDWPYGSVKDAYLAKNWGKPVAMAMAACTLRECAGVPDQLQYMQRAGTLHGSFGKEVSNGYVFTCLENREHDQGYGLIGWTFDALDDFIAFCRASGLNPRSLETQLYFMAYQYYASDSWHQRYTYLFSYESAEPTLENVQTIARIHTSCVGMGSVPSVVYPAPTRDVEQILANWGNKTFPDLVGAASGAYAFLYQTAYNQQPGEDELAGIAESSMYSGATGTEAVPGSMLDTTPAQESGGTGSTGDSTPSQTPDKTGSGGNGKGGSGGTTDTGTSDSGWTGKAKTKPSGQQTKPSGGTESTPEETGGAAAETP